MPLGTLIVHITLHVLSIQVSKVTAESKESAMHKPYTNHIDQ